MNQYKHILFDLDYTLWDFGKNCEETLKELYQKYRLEGNNFSVADFYREYMIVNDELWRGYNLGTVTKEQIRGERFLRTFKALGFNGNSILEEINEDFMRICPAKGHLLPFVKQTLDYLSGKYEMHILTNGFAETQFIKLTTSGIAGYFREVVNSESCSSRKPNKDFFDFAVTKIGCNNEHCIMIGDDLHADIIGARNASIDHIFFNWRRMEHQEKIHKEIYCLSELKEIL